MLFKEKTKENIEKTIKENYWGFVAAQISGVDNFNWNMVEADIANRLEDAKKEADYYFNADNCSNHKPIYDGKDLSEHLKKICYSGVEMSLLIRIQNCDVITSEIMDMGSARSVGSYYGSKKIYSKILNDTTLNNIDDYILVHNHPGVIAIKPSNLDILHAARSRTIFSALGGNLVDYMIVGEYDMYSVLQHDETLSVKERLFSRSRFTKEEIAKIEEEYGYRLSVLARI